MEMYGARKTVQCVDKGLGNDVAMSPSKQEGSTNRIGESEELFKKKKSKKKNNFSADLNIERRLFDSARF